MTTDFPASTSKAERRAVSVSLAGSDAPIYCEGGCGGIVGFVPKGHRMIHYLDIKYAHWCVQCAAADRAKQPNK